MRFYEDECVGCPPERGCLGSCCPYKNVLHWRCDGCGDEDVPLYEFEDKELCMGCIEQSLTQVNEGVW